MMDDDEDPIVVEGKHKLEDLDNECCKCINDCIQYLECAENKVVYSKDENDCSMSEEANKCDVLPECFEGDAVLRKPLKSSRATRRQNLTSRKKSTTVCNVKTSGNRKKVGKCETSGPTKTLYSTRQRSNRLDLIDPIKSGKKLRKGYVYELVPADVAQTSVLDATPLASSDRQPPTYNECGTQTMGKSHFFAILIEQLVNDQAEFNAGSTLDLPVTLPYYVSRRLMVTQQLLMQQSEELNKIYKENMRLHGVVNSFASVIRKFSDGYITDLRRLRDSVEVLKREFSFYQDEFVAEANKSVDNIHALKEQFQRKLEDFERKNRLLSARIDLHIKEKEAAEELADGYLREISARDRDVILANKLRDRAERKLKDTLYVANNAKCAHCQISEKMRTHLTSAIAEKTVLLEKCQKECSDLQRRADHADRISQILSKDGEKLRFELNTWKSDAERSLVEISKLKEELKKAAASSSTKSSVTMQTHSGDKVGSITTKEPVHSRSPVTRTSVVKATPNDYELTVKEQVDANVNHAPPIPPIMPTPPEEPDSPWLPRERRLESSPSAPFFAGQSSSLRHVHASTSGWRNTPFNGPVLNDRLISKLDGEAVPPPSLGERARNGIAKSSELIEERTLMKAREKESLNIPDVGVNGTHFNGRNSRRSKERGENSGSCPVRGSRSLNKSNDSQRVRSPVPRRNSSRESRKRRTSGSSRYERDIRNHQLKNSCTRPFNGPVSLSGEDGCITRTHAQCSSQTRSVRLSDSPLPWHRDHSNNTGRASEMPFSPPYHCDNAKVYDEDHFRSGPVTQRLRRNFWEP